MYDIIIIGCGPAGMSAAIYALRAGERVLILEKETIGGKIASSPLVENYPGFKGISGSALSEKLYEQVLSLGGEIELEEVLQIEDGPIKKVITDESTYEAGSIILASGTTFRKLGLPSEEEFLGNGISFCTVCDGAFYKDKMVAVVGGGSSALIHALSLADLCKKVYLIHRRETLSGEDALVEEVEQSKNIEVLYNSEVLEFIGKDTLNAICIREKDEEKILSLEGVFLSIGQIPQTDYLKGLINVNAQNYIESNEECTTNKKGIFVAGDLRDKKYRQLTTAMNDGTVAALNAIAYLKKEKKTVNN